jgi:uncharacterized heparinase superfamily protein
MSFTRYFRTVGNGKPGQVKNRLLRRVRKPGSLQNGPLDTSAPRHRWRLHASPPASVLLDEQTSFLSETARLSLGIVNTIKWLLAGNEPREGMLASLAMQARTLSRQVEYHAPGNDILASARALVFAGTFFCGGEETGGWLQQGLKLLEKQLQTQILADGGHFERSPMYHSIILMDVLDLVQLGQLYPEAAIGQRLDTLRQTAAAMVGWLDGLLHPDFQIAFFNDAAFGVAPAPMDILRYARSLGVEQTLLTGPINHFEASGYVAMRSHDQVALLNLAPIGPDYIAGHAHADTLSFEWSLFGQRVLVNSGTSEYAAGPERSRQRSTAAHNTVGVNGRDSTEVRSSFRPGRRARPFNIRSEQGVDLSCTIGASHTGYHGLFPKVTHSREWRLRSGALEVNDTLKGRFKQAKAHFYFHPAVRVTIVDGRITFALPLGRRGEVVVDGGEAEVVDSTWHPGFGVSRPNKCLVVSFREGVVRTQFIY